MVMRDWKVKIDGILLGPLEVLGSGAGFYIGRMAHDPDDDLTTPGTRESNYFRTFKVAEKALKTGDWEVRICMENEQLYRDGLPRPIALKISR